MSVSRQVACRYAMECLQANGDILTRIVGISGRGSRMTRKVATVK